MTEHLSLNKIYNIAVEVGEKIGLVVPPKNKVYRELKKKVPLPIILQDGSYQMWIDKYYLAYGLVSQEDVNYVYISKTHISEEIWSYLDASKSRKRKIELTKGMKDLFDKYLKEMIDKDLEYVLEDWIVNVIKVHKSSQKFTKR